MTLGACEEIAIDIGSAQRRLAPIICEKLTTCKNISLPIGTPEQCAADSGWGMQMASQMLGYNHIMDSQKEGFENCLANIKAMSCENFFKSSGQLCIF